MLWEESWRVILRHNYVVLCIDSTNPRSSFENLPHWFLSHTRNDKLEIQKFGDRGKFNELFYLLEHDFQGELRRPTKRTVWLKSKSRGNLVLAVDILDANWMPSRSQHRRRQIQKGMGHVERDYHDRPKGEFHGYINGLCGRDLCYGNCVRLMKIWKLVDVALSPRTIDYGHWRPAVTTYMEEELGPNLSRDPLRLTFRPKYFQDFCRLTNLSYKGIFDFMRRRNHLSDNVEFDIAEDKAGRDEEDPHRNIWDEPLDSRHTVYAEVEAEDGAAAQATEAHALVEAMQACFDN